MIHAMLSTIHGKATSARRRLRRLLRPDVHICICGFPRSGTTLIYNTLCSALVGFNYKNREQRAVEALRDPGHTISKHPFDVMELKELPNNNPHGKRLLAVIVLRDVRDIITSRHATLPEHYFIGYEYTLQKRGEWPHYEPYPGGPGVRDIAAAIAGLKGWTGLSVEYVRYEDFVSAPNDLQGRLERHPNVRFSRRLSEVDGATRVRGVKYEGQLRPVEASLVKVDRDVTKEFCGRWRSLEHRARILEEFMTYPELHRLLQAYGYETSDAWFARFLEAADRQEAAHLAPPARPAERFGDINPPVA